MNYLSGGFKDGQCAVDHSWWITEQGAWVIRLSDAKDREALYEKLLKPPLRFCLTLLNGDGNKNHLHLDLVNDHKEIKADTRLEFTINSILHSWNVHELENALRHGPEGKEPGVQAFLRLLGPYQLKGEDPQKRKTGGNPNPIDVAAARRTVAAKSGR